MKKKGKKKQNEAPKPELQVPKSPDSAEEDEEQESQRLTHYEPNQLGCPDAASFKKLSNSIISDWDVDIHRHKFTNLEDWISITLFCLKEGATHESIGSALDCTGATIGKIIHETIDEIHPHWTKMVHRMAVQRIKQSNHISLRSHQYVVFMLGHQKAAKFRLYLSENGGFFGFPHASQWNEDTNRILEDIEALQDLQSGDIIFLQNGYNLDQRMMADLRIKGVCIFHENPAEGDTPQLTDPGFLNTRDLVAHFYNELKSYRVFQTHHFNPNSELEKLTTYLAVVSSLITYYELQSDRLPQPLHPVEWLKYKMQDFQHNLEMVSDQLHHQQEEEQEQDVGDQAMEEEEIPTKRHHKQSKVQVEGRQKKIVRMKFTNPHHHFHWNKQNKRLHEMLK